MKVTGHGERQTDRQTQTGWEGPQRGKESQIQKMKTENTEQGERKRERTAMDGRKERGRRTTKGEENERERETG